MLDVRDVMKNTKYSWKHITREDVLKAIRKFEFEQPEYRAPRNTFLLWNDKKLPAKFIRYMAYKEHYKGTDLTKEDLQGGRQTVDFFKNLGFDCWYKGEIVGPEEKDKSIFEEENAKNTELILSSKEIDESKIEVSEEYNPFNLSALKVGCYIETVDQFDAKSFNQMVDRVRNSDIDILVFPEISSLTFFYNNEVVDFEKRYDFFIEKGLELSKRLSCAVVFGIEFGNDYEYENFAVYANAMADEDDTDALIYNKHTMTSISAFDFKDYFDYGKINMYFPIIKYRDHFIGLTICYDCNHAMFSRIYGLAGVDAIINITGGNVKYHKWHRYNRVRSIENHCYNFITMGGEAKNNSYAFGFNPNGKELKPYTIGNKTVINADKYNEPGEIYVYDTALDDKGFEADNNLEQKGKIKSKDSDFEIPKGNIDSLLDGAEKIEENLYISPYNQLNIVFIIVQGEDIYAPEKVLSKMYQEKLKEYKNKRYIVVNKYPTLTVDDYEKLLFTVLRVRAMENFCVVILEGGDINICLQSTNIKESQVIEPKDGYYNVALARAKGPENIWKNKKNETKSKWREGYEFLIDVAMETVD